MKEKKKKRERERERESPGTLGVRLIPGPIQSIADSGRSKLRSKTATHYQNPNMHKLIKSKLSVSSIERSPLVVANSIVAEVTNGFNFSHTNFN